MMYLISICIGVFLGFLSGKTALGISVIGLGFVISIITQLVCYHSHVHEIEKIEEVKKDIEIYKEQADEVLAEIKLYLIDQFPEHELKIFDKITQQTVDILAVKYPELKSDEVFKKYIDSLVEYKDSIYRAKIRINGYEQRIRTRQRTIGLTVFPILPKYNS